MRRTLLVLPTVLAAIAASADSLLAQVPQPPPRGKDNHWQATAPQHDPLDVMLTAWVECLSPHITRIEDHELRSRLAAELQNQYSDHAVWDFRQELGRILQDDLHMTRHAWEELGGEELILGGGELDPPLVDVLMRLAVDTSGEALGYDELYGTPDSLESVHHAVLVRDPSVLKRLASAVRKDDLTRDQEFAIADLRKRYVPLLMNDLPVQGSRQTKEEFREMFEEALATPITDRAVQGIRSKLRGALWETYRKKRTITTGSDFLEYDRVLEGQVDELTSRAFWARLAYHHERMIVDPENHRKNFRSEGKELRVSLVEPAEASAKPGRSGSYASRDTVVLKNGKEVTGRLLQVHDPEGLVLLQGTSRETYDHEDVAALDYARRRLKHFLDHRRPGLSIEAEWDLVWMADSLGLERIAHLQAIHVVLRQPQHALAHEYLDHKETRRGWKWPYGKGGRKKLTLEKLEKRMADWKDRLVLESENWTLETNTSMRAAVDTLFDLEHLYCTFMDEFGKQLVVPEFVDRQDCGMTMHVFREKEDRGYKDYIWADRKDPYYDPSRQSKTKKGNPNLAFTYYQGKSERPLQLFDIGTQQLIYSLMYYGRRKGGELGSWANRFSTWAEFGLGHWYERRRRGPAGYPTFGRFELLPETANLALEEVDSGPLERARHEVTNLVGLECRLYFGLDRDVDRHRAKARSFVAFLLEKNPQVEGKRKRRSSGRLGLEHYMREAFGTARAHSSDALDEGLAETRVEKLEKPWKDWLRAHAL